MKTSKIAMGTLAVASIALAGVVIAPTMLPSATGQGQQNQAPQQNPGGPGAGPQQFRRGGGRQGGFGGGNMPFAIGTVTAVDPAAKTITITSQFGGNSETIQVSDTTKIESQVTAAVTDLKTGDHVQVQGVPTGILASSLTIGENPMAQGRPGGGGPGGFPGGPGGNPMRPGGAAQPASADANGSVTSTNPLTISLGEGASLTLKTDSKTKVTKFATVGLDGIKVGDRIFSQGQSSGNNAFAATSVNVNMQGGGVGGFGQRGGQFPGGMRRGGQFPGGPPQGGQFPGGPPQGGQFPGGPPQGGQFPGGPPQGGQFPGGQPAPPPAPDNNGF